MPLPPQPARLSLARLPTPLTPLDRISDWVNGGGSGPRIWVKRDDLTGSLLTGNKVRKLEFTLAQALAEHCNTVITCGGLQSNHCRATALLCAQLGLKCHLILRGEPVAVPDGNLLLDQLAGATIRYYPPRDYQPNLERYLQELKAECDAGGDRAYIIPTGASDGVGVWGYLNACDELKQDFEQAGITPGHIICATGSGGTQAGLTLGAHLLDLHCQVWGINVCDDEAWFLNKVRRDVADWAARYSPGFDPDALATRVIDGYVGAGYAIADDAVFQTIARLARMEGLVLDPVYTGKAFHGLIEEIRAGSFGRDGDLVFIHTGGSFGLFPQREQLVQALAQA